MRTFISSICLLVFSFVVNAQQAEKIVINNINFDYNDGLILKIFGRDGYSFGPYTLKPGQSKTLVRKHIGHSTDDGFYDGRDGQVTDNMVFYVSLNGDNRMDDVGIAKGHVFYTPGTSGAFDLVTNFKNLSTIGNFHTVTDLDGIGGSRSAKVSAARSGNDIIINIQKNW